MIEFNGTLKREDFTECQIEMLEECTEYYGWVDLAIPGLTDEQMYEICEAFKCGIDVEPWAKPEVPVETMRQMRLDGLRYEFLALHNISRKTAVAYAIKLGVPEDYLASPKLNQHILLNHLGHSDEHEDLRNGTLNIREKYGVEYNVCYKYYLAGSFRDTLLLKARDLGFNLKDTFCVEQVVYEFEIQLNQFLLENLTDSAIIKLW